MGNVATAVRLGRRDRALAAELTHPDPLTVTGHEPRPAIHAPVTVDVEIVRAGRA